MVESLAAQTNWRNESKTVSIFVCGCRWHYLDARFHELISPLQSLWLDDFNVGAVGAS